MELLLATSALAAAGLLYQHTQQGSNQPTPRHTNVRRDPTGATVSDKRVAPVHTSAPVLPRHQQGTLSGKRDHSLNLDSTSPYQATVGQYYNQPTPKRERQRTEAEFVAGKTDNVFVRSNVGYDSEYRKTMQAPSRMHGVNPIASTTGTNGQLVGPGLMTNDQTGTHGLHYGAVRMRPQLTHPTYREQKGAVVPGKVGVDARPTPLTLNENGSNGFTITPSGFAAVQEGETRPQRFHAISTDYFLAAKGRAVVDGTPGPGGQRVEPTPAAHSTRGTESDLTGHRVAAGLEAADLRGFRHDQLDTRRGTRNEHSGPLGTSVPAAFQALQGSQTAVATEARAMTGPQTHYTNLAGPVAHTLNNNTPLDPTQRGTNNTFENNIAVQAPPAPGGIGEAMRHTGRVTNEYRPGAVGVTSLMTGANTQAQSALTRSTQPNQRSGTQQEVRPGALKAVGVDGPTSQDEIRGAQMYSNDLEQRSFTPAASVPNNFFEPGAYGKVELPPLPPDSARAGAPSREVNLQVARTPFERVPNKETGMLNMRLDPGILKALEANHLSQAAVA